MFDRICVFALTVYVPDFTEIFYGRSEGILLLLPGSGGICSSAGYQTFQNCWDKKERELWKNWMGYRRILVIRVRLRYISNVNRVGMR